MIVLPAYRDAHAYTGRYLILYGGAGSGKSVYAAQRILLRCLRESAHRVLVVRKVARTLRASTFQLLLDTLRKEGALRQCYVNRTELIIRFPSGSEIIHAGLDDAEKLKSVAGITGVWIEEATELSEDDFTQVDLRLRGTTPHYQQLILTFNPIDARHWLKRRFFDEQRGHPHICRTTYQDNPFAGTAYTSLLESITDENLRRIYADGEWGLPMRGLIYPSWTTSPMPDGGDACYGLDFGYNAPTALVRVVATETDLYADEVLHETHLTNADLIERLKAVVPDRSAPIYADAAEPDRIEEIHRAGFNIHPAEKDVAGGIDAVKRYRLHVTPHSAALQAELRTYKWAEDRAGAVLDRPVKFMDHCADALRYAVYTHYSQPEGWLVL